MAGNAIEVYHEDFESGDGGFTVDNSGGTLPGLWHYSLGRHNDGLSGHTPFHNFYYGAGESSTGGGRYDILPFDHQGVLISPLIQLPAEGVTTLMFSYLLDTRTPIDVDFVEVAVDDGNSITTILSRADGTLPETGGIWFCQSADLTPFNGDEIRLLFSFDTGDVPRVDPEGWYVDDIWISNVPPTGTKFNDLNADGTRDPDGADDVAGNADDEVGLPGWEIQAYEDLDANGVLDATDIANGIVSSAVTDSQGRYTLSLAMGNYILVEAQQPGWFQSSPTTTVNAMDASLGTMGFAATVTDGTPLEDQDFGNFQPDISGYKWDDQNGDGVWDPGEPGLNGWTIYLDENGNEMLDAGERQFETRSDGFRDGVFWFTGLTARDYAVREVLQSGWAQSYPGLPALEHIVAVDPPNNIRVNANFEDTAAPNFGNRVTGALSGYKWDDLNRDGMWDANEPGVDGVIIELFDAFPFPSPMPQPIRETITEPDGGYEFVDLLPGDYWVCEVVPNGRVQTYPGPVPCHPITIIGGQTLSGRREVTEPPNFGNRVISADVEIVTKRANRVTVQPGETLTYTITFFNDGPDAAANAMVTDTVPAGTTFVDARILRGSNWELVNPPAAGGTGDIRFSNDSAPRRNSPFLKSRCWWKAQHPRVP